MTEVFFIPAPECPVHRQMHHSDALCQWECRGWDGEGCEHTVTDETWLRSAQPLGTTDAIAIDHYPPDGSPLYPVGGPGSSTQYGPTIAGDVECP
jgi:hypothetical protein